MAIVRNFAGSPAAPYEDPVVGSVRSIVSDLLAAGCPSLPAVARRAGISVRTLQRHLATVGLTYSDLVVEVRLKILNGNLNRPYIRNL